MNRSRDMDPWYQVSSAGDLPTPALLIFPDRIETNIKQMIQTAGNPDRLRPHVKTHKMSEVVKLKIRLGISRFKCSTIAEAEMVAICGGRDILLAMQPVGPHVERFFKLQMTYPRSRFSAIVDSDSIVEQIAGTALALKQTADLWLDINNGMDRTGISPGKKALELYLKINSLPYIALRGLHVYDGHIHESDPAERRKMCDRDFEPVISLIGSVKHSGVHEPQVVAGGTPTFPIHAARANTETSPGTSVLWDSGYTANFPDLHYLPAAVIMTRVVSKPGGRLVCTDLGHKAIAAEMPHPRVYFPDIPVTRFVAHNEEHLVFESPAAGHLQPGDVLYGIPWHICPTVPRYKSAYVIRNGNVYSEWQVDARDRIITL